MTDREFPIKKSETMKRIVYGEVYAPGVPDADNEFMDAETIEKMAHQFMKDMNLRNIDVQHDNNLVENACVVESFIARKGDPDFIAGSWVVGVHVPDDATWNRIIKGEINGFSLEAMVYKQPMTMEIEVPPVLSGKTSKSDDHEHEFFVSYDEQGNFLGGVTDEVNGHKHVIKRGTATEPEAGHSHRFSFIESLYGERYPS